MRLSIQLNERPCREAFASAWMTWNMMETKSRRSAKQTVVEFCFLIKNLFFLVHNKKGCHCLHNPLLDYIKWSCPAWWKRKMLKSWSKITLCSHFFIFQTLWLTHEWLIVLTYYICKNLKCMTLLLLSIHSVLMCFLPSHDSFCLLEDFYWNIFNFFFHLFVNTHHLLVSVVNCIYFFYRNLIESFSFERSAVFK